jgi:hypothetical protein
MLFLEILYDSVAYLDRDSVRLLLSFERIIASNTYMYEDISNLLCKLCLSHSTQQSRRAQTGARGLVVNGKKGSLCELRQVQSIQDDMPYLSTQPDAVLHWLTKYFHDLFILRK